MIQAIHANASSPEADHDDLSGLSGFAQGHPEAAADFREFFLCRNAKADRWPARFAQSGRADRSR
jgi:hypothetical protein